MNNYTQTPQNQESYQAATAETDRPTAIGRPLVPTPISHRNPTDEIHFFPTSFRVKRYDPSQKCHNTPDRTATKIDSFSNKSKSRLRFAAVNAPKPFISQFLLTYHGNIPKDGRTSKKHLDAFLKVLKRIYPGISYLWILEFQTKRLEQAPHYHVYLSIPPDENLEKIGIAWNRITNETEEHLKFHTHSNIWMDWDMGSAQYLAKYLDKESQKLIPEGYENFGRFWANSRNSKPIPLVIPIDDLDDVSTVDQETGEIYGGETTILRWLGRLAEKQTNGYSKFKKRSAHGSYTILQGAKAYAQIEDYFYKLNYGGNNNGHARNNFARFADAA